VVFEFVGGGDIGSVLDTLKAFKSNMTEPQIAYSCAEVESICLLYDKVDTESFAISS
jgi:hypothetical protein